MKTFLGTIGLATLGLLASSFGADKRTADYLLTSPLTHEGQDVTVDVAFVKPIRWTSPLPEVAFFHSMTIDRGDYKPGGHILVAVPAKEAEAFAKKYGTEVGRRDSDSLKGKFIAAGNGGPAGGGKVWVIDTTGQLAELIAKQKLEFPREVLLEGGMPPGNRKPGPR